MYAGRLNASLPALIQQACGFYENIRLNVNVLGHSFRRCRLCWALAIAVIAHLAVLQRIDFSAANQEPYRSHKINLEVTVVRPPTATATQSSAHVVEAVKTPANPVEKKPAQKPVGVETKKSQRKSVEKTADTPDSKKDTPVLSQRPLNPALLAQQVAELGNSYAQQRIEQAREKRIVYVNNVTKDRYEAIEYERAFWEKVGRIGNLNYPDAARGKELSGRLRLAVGINHDGSLYSIQIRQSSGERVLDEAALHIVRLAAPFAPLPLILSQQVDVLVITGVWDWRFINDKGLR